MSAQPAIAKDAPSASISLMDLPARRAGHFECANSMILMFLRRSFSRADDPYIFISTC
jgi:hypothetical protein